MFLWKRKVMKGGRQKNKNKVRNWDIKFNIREMDSTVCEVNKTLQIQNSLSVMLNMLFDSRQKQSDTNAYIISWRAVYKTVDSFEELFFNCGWENLQQWQHKKKKNACILQLKI